MTPDLRRDWHLVAGAWVVLIVAWLVLVWSAPVGADSGGFWDWFWSW